MSSALEAEFALQLRALGLPPPATEYRFHDTRRWRFDFAWPVIKLAVEIEGGTYAKGRHTRPMGFQGDCEKYNQATICGWRVLRFTARDVKSGEGVEVLREALRIFSPAGLRSAA